MAAKKIRHGLTGRDAEEKGGEEVRCPEGIRHLAKYILLGFCYKVGVMKLRRLGLKALRELVERKKVL